MDESQLDAIERKQKWQLFLADVAVVVLLAGLLIDLVYIFVSDKPRTEKVITFAADFLIFTGVAGELVFAHRANRTGDAVQAELRARLTAAVDRLSEVEFANGFLEQSAAKANERAATAELETQRLKKQMAPRFAGPKLVAALAEHPPSRAAIMYLKDSSEAFMLANWIVAALVQARWTIEEYGPIPPSTNPLFAQLPSALAAGGQINGVTIVVRSSPDAELSSGWTNAVLPEAWRANILRYSPVLLALAEGLLADLGHVGIRHAADVPEGLFRIVVGEKP